MADVTAGGIWPGAMPDRADPGAPREVSTGWTGTIPAVQLPKPAAPQTVGDGARGRILVIEGGYGAGGRRHWGRGAGSQAQVLSAMLAGVSPGTLLAAESVDAVHLPGATDPQSVLAHLRAAALHPGPLLIHLGGHLVTDRRGEHLYLTLRDSKPATVRQDGLPWQALAAELQHRGELPTLVIADLSADQAAWPLVQSAISPLADGIPLWAVVSPDPEQIGTFSRALIEVLHRGRPGGPALLPPELLRDQVHSVVRNDSIILHSHPTERPFFRNTSRQINEALPGAAAGPRPAAVLVPPKGQARTPKPRPGIPAVQLGKPAVASAGVSLLKPGVPPTPRRVGPPVSLLKVLPAAPGSSVVSLDKRPTAVSFDKPIPDPTPDPRPVDYREAIGRIVRSAEAGEHDTAAELALALEESAVAAHGPVAAEVLQVRQVRAHIARLAGRPAQAAEVYREVALTLLRSRGADDPETQQAATNAEACWRAVQDRTEAIRMAPEIIELRAHLPGPDGRKLRAAERHLKQLAAAGSAQD
ncbi:hypothetical protein F4556_001139 [Kitasatospora gansuensis]|uniref:Tetratricopeptide repeat protein n=1 Tax=Kitasatospora gansuensis TaxID=258050 RepID=A0A7W7S810_9ACTN|nr:hypothetical protein [Kitasatospora gansuensis]MBB4945604.1 hypothetical protein [Kitasatospora gansuensis]